MCNFEIRVPFQSSTCRLRVLICMQIVDNEFAFVEKDPWFQQYENSITGRFDTRTHALGNYSVRFCGDTHIFTPSEGAWEASK